MENKTQTETKTEKHEITITARRWFQRTYGNTYHSVHVWVDDEEIGYNPFRYGYDEQYLFTAFEILQKAGVYPDTGRRANGFNLDYNEFLMDIRKPFRKHIFHINCYDVPRKKDL